MKIHAMILAAVFALIVALAFLLCGCSLFNVQVQPPAKKATDHSTQHAQPDSLMPEIESVTETLVSLGFAVWALVERFRRKKLHRVVHAQYRAKGEGT